MYCEYHFKLYELLNPSWISPKTKNVKSVHLKKFSDICKNHLARRNLFQ